MAEPGPGTSPPRLALAAVAALALLVPASGAIAATHPAPPVPLSGWPGSGTTFPRRAVVLYPPAGVALTASQIHVAENGVPVTRATLDPMSAAKPGDVGVMLVVDQNSSMAGEPLKGAVAAVHRVAADRTAQQELGVVTFDAKASVLLHPSGDANAIASALAAMPGTGSGANVAGGTMLALSELAQSKVALGAIVVISDGAGRLVSPGGPATATARAAAAAVRVPVFTIGLGDAASSPATMNALRAASPGQFVSSTAAQLSNTVHTIVATVTRGYILHYASRQPAGHQIAATVTANGVPGKVEIGYRAPAAPHPTTRSRTQATRSRTHAPPRVPVSANQFQYAFAHTTPLSPTPSFALLRVAPTAPLPAPAATSFWGSSASIPVVAGISGVLIVLALVLLFRRPASRGVRVRVGKFIPGPEDTEFGDLVPVKSQRSSRGLFARMWLRFVQDVAIARSAHTPVDLVKRSAAIGLVLAILVTVVSGTVLLGLVPLLLWPFALRSLMKRGARKQRELFIDTLPGYLQDLASAMRVGRSFASALAIVAATADEPVRSELERAVTDEALGRPIDESLQAVAVRMQANDVEQVALIAALNRRSGSNVAEALDRVAEGARDRADLRREIKALTGQAKMSSWVLTSLPPLLLVGIIFISPLYAKPLLHTTWGIVLLCVGALMVFAGWKVMQKITTIKT